MYTGNAYAKMAYYRFNTNKASPDKYIVVTFYMKSFHEIGDSTILSTAGVSFILQWVSSQMRLDSTSNAKQYIFSRLSKHLIKMIDLTSSVEIYKNRVPKSCWVCGTLIAGIQATHERAQHYLTEMLRIDLEKASFNESYKDDFKDGLKVECLKDLVKLCNTSPLLVRVLRWIDGGFEKDWNSEIDFSAAFVPLPNQYIPELIDYVRNVYSCDLPNIKDFNEKFEEYKKKCYTKPKDIIHDGIDSTETTDDGWGNSDPDSDPQVTEPTATVEPGTTEDEP